jgi:hypothetical protein
MISEVTDRDTVAAYVKAARERLKNGEHDDAAARAVAALGIDVDSPRDAALRLAHELPEDGLGPGSQADLDEPFISRDPLVSVLQSSLAEAVRRNGLATETPGDHPHHGLFSHVWQSVETFIEAGRLKTRGVELSAEVVDGMLERLLESTHAFNPAPAEHAIGDCARVIVVGDWGSGQPGAHAVGGLMAQEVATGVQMGREVHVIHLGDVYFAGQPDEYRNHVLADGWWPVNAEQSDRGVGSWSLAGNHDLYGGARAYFDVLLADPRFHLQRSPDGQPTSWFRLTSPSWQIIGLDSSWDDHPFSMGQTGQLQAPQGEVITRWLQDADHKHILLSHHQFMTVYDDRLLRVAEPPALVSSLNPLVDRGRVMAWFWGHEHRCMAFTHPHLGFPRCIGHGGQMQAAHPAETQPPDPGLWEETASCDDGGKRWNRFGFAVLDIDGPQIEMRYVLNGAQPRIQSEHLV